MSTSSSPRIKRTVSQNTPQVAPKKTAAKVLQELKELTTTVNNLAAVVKGLQVQSTPVAVPVSVSVPASIPVPVAVPVPVVAVEATPMSASIPVPFSTPEISGNAVTPMTSPSSVVSSPDPLAAFSEAMCRYSPEEITMWRELREVKFTGEYKRDKNWVKTLQVPKWNKQYSAIPHVYVRSVVDYTQALGGNELDAIRLLLSGFMDNSSQTESTWAVMLLNSKPESFAMVVDNLFDVYAASASRILKRQQFLQLKMKPGESFTAFIRRFKVFALQRKLIQLQFMLCW